MPRARNMQVRVPKSGLQPLRVSWAWGGKLNGCRYGVQWRSNWVGASADDVPLQSTKSLEGSSVWEGTSARTLVPGML